MKTEQVLPTMYKISSILQCLLFFILSFHSVEAFVTASQTIGTKPIGSIPSWQHTTTSPSSSLERSSTKMMAFGLEKLNFQIDTENPRVEPSTEKSLFGRRAGSSSQQNGNDERVGSSNLRTAQSLRDEVNDALFQIEMNFKKKKLLDGLSGDWSEAEKLERIRIAERLDGTLQSSTSMNDIRTASMDPRGEFTDEWHFDV